MMPTRPSRECPPTERDLSRAEFLPIGTSCHPESRVVCGSKDLNLNQRHIDRHLLAHEQILNLAKEHGPSLFFCILVARSSCPSLLRCSELGLSCRTASRGGADLPRPDEFVTKLRRRTNHFF
jgi:hypothetical protein